MYLSLTITIINFILVLLGNFLRKTMSILCERLGCCVRFCVVSFAKKLRNVVECAYTSSVPLRQNNNVNSRLMLWSEAIVTVYRSIKAGICTLMEYILGSQNQIRIHALIGIKPIVDVFVDYFMVNYIVKLLLQFQKFTIFFLFNIAIQAINTCELNI